MTCRSCAFRKYRGLGWWWSFCSRTFQNRIKWQGKQHYGWRMKDKEADDNSLKLHSRRIFRAINQITIYTSVDEIVKWIKTPRSGYPDPFIERNMGEKEPTIFPLLHFSGRNCQMNKITNVCTKTLGSIPKNSFRYSSSESLYT